MVKEKSLICDLNISRTSLFVNYFLYIIQAYFMHHSGLFHALSRPVRNHPVLYFHSETTSAAMATARLVIRLISSFAGEAAASR